MILIVGVFFHKLVFTVNSIVFFVCSTCDVICKVEETIVVQILAYFVSLFYYLNEFQNFKMVSWVVIPSKLNIYTINSEYIFPCSPPFKHYNNRLSELTSYY